MQISQSKADNVHILNIEGDIDLNSSPQLRKTFNELLEKGSTKVVVNFEKVAYIDSSGLATLIEMMQRLKKSQGVICLVQMNDKIRNIFEITKLDKLFTIYRTQQEALA